MALGRAGQSKSQRYAVRYPGATKCGATGSVLKVVGRVCEVGWKCYRQDIQHDYGRGGRIGCEYWEYEGAARAFPNCQRVFYKDFSILTTSISMSVLALDLYL